MEQSQSKKTVGVLLTFYTALQSTPLFVSNIIFYTILYFSCFIYLVLKQQIKIKYNYYVAFSLLWLTYSFISILWSVDTYLWFRNSVILFILFLGILIFQSIVKDKDDVLYLSRIWFWIFLAINIVAWIEISTGTYLFTYSHLVSDYSTEKWPVFSFINVNDFCAYLTISGAVSFAYIKTQTKKSLKVLFAVLLLSTLLICVQSVARANILAIVLGSLFVGFISLVRKFIKLTHRPSFAVALIMLVGIGIAATILNEELMHILDSPRYNLMRDTIFYLRSSKYLGVGSGNLEYYLARYPIFRYNTIAYAHVWWVEVLGNFGVLIFVGYIYFWIKLLYNNIVGMLNRQKLAPLNVLVIIVFSVAVLGPSSVLLMKWLPVITGFIVASTSIVRKENIEVRIVN